MRAALNPFSPGSGLRPPALVGREAELNALDVLIERTTHGLSGRGIVMSGLRGVGKTVLLNEMSRRAEAADWFVVSVEARGDRAGGVSIRQTLAREIATQARALAGRTLSGVVHRALASVAAFSVSVGSTGVSLGVEVTPGRADSGDLEVDMTELVEDLSGALRANSRAFVLLIDEFQDVDAELLGALLATQHRAGQRGWPFYIVGAGLPHLPGVLAEARSYAERLFDYRAITRLSADTARQALHDPITTAGATIDDPALTLLTGASGGYPYFLQEYGSSAWDLSPGPNITYNDAQAAVTLGLERLDQGFFRARWERATPAERNLLTAMARDGEGPSNSSEVAVRMGLRPSSLGPYRAKLIHKGLIYAPDHGQLAYTVPGMADFVGRQHGA
jgi:hypothetical protein